ncbi:MAG: biotin/lipoyl attachment protein [Pelosinus sp.]|jgi:biotin carboxyl carrier protein|nr:biotin/lipoyl attachment protein [Pelosinus sp.]
MTSYTITVNGKSYDVTVQKKKTASCTAPTSEVALPASGENEKVIAPMPGKIIELNVRVGDSVKKGQALLIMEAMKMHNPVLAAKGGVISQLFVKVNDPVQSGQPLLSIK